MMHAIICMPHLSATKLGFIFFLFLPPARRREAVSEVRSTRRYFFPIILQRSLRIDLYFHPPIPAVWNHLVDHYPHA